jgi:hypothetical protein
MLGFSSQPIFNQTCLVLQDPFEITKNMFYEQEKSTKLEQIAFFFLFRN